MFSEEQLYSIALRRCSLIGDINFHKLVKSIGSAKEVWGFSKKELGKILGIGSKTTQEIGSSEHLKFAENEIEFCRKNNIQIKLRHLRELPDLLSECEDAPSILYVKGIINHQLKPLSIVGTRNITSYGKAFVEGFLAEIPKDRIQTVSGLAIGVDAEVHQHSISNKIPTIAVLAHGFHTLYPAKKQEFVRKNSSRKRRFDYRIQFFTKTRSRKLHSTQPNYCRSFQSYNCCGNSFWRRFC